MNDKIKEIRGFIWSYIDNEIGEIIEHDKFDDLYGLIRYVNEYYNCEIKLRHVGGFDSPGYDIDCYAWAGVIDGELYFDSLEQESY